MESNGTLLSKLLTLYLEFGLSVCKQLENCKAPGFVGGVVVGTE